MRAFLVLLGCLLGCTGLADAAESPLPDLLFHAAGGWGGFGRLVHDSAANRYRLVDGRVNAYVVDGDRIRARHPDERSGTGGNPQRVVGLTGRLYGATAYARILEFDAITGAVLNTHALGAFRYGGGAQPAIYASDKALLVLDRQRVLALDPQLKIVGELRLGNDVGHRMETSPVQVGAQLHSLVIDNRRPAANCVGECAPVVIRHAVIDFSQPSDVRISSRAEVLQEITVPSRRAVDVAAGGWLIASHDYTHDAPVLEWRSFEQLAIAAARLRLDAGSRIEAATEAAPFWLVVSTQGGERHLARVEVSGKTLTLRKYPLGWHAGTAPRFSIAADRDARIYLAANHQLAVYETKDGTPRLRLQQQFVSAATGASQLQLEGLTPVTLPPPHRVVDRARLAATLAKRYWNAADQLAIEAEIDKLTTSDGWAIAVFTELARNRALSYHGGVHHAARALQKFGPAATAAVPVLVAATMEGAAIRGDVLAAVIPALRSIDPRGDAVRDMLPDCIRRTYVCEHVGKEILRGLRD